MPDEASIPRYWLAEDLWGSGACMARCIDHSESEYRGEQIYVRLEDHEAAMRHSFDVAMRAMDRNDRLFDRMVNWQNYAEHLYECGECILTDGSQCAKGEELRLKAYNR